MKYVGKTSGSVTGKCPMVNILVCVILCLFHRDQLITQTQNTVVTDCDVIFVCRVTEESTPYFVLQHRRGHGKSKGLSSILVGTLDSIFDTKPPPYRILHQTPSSEVYYRMYNIYPNRASSLKNILYFFTSLNTLRNITWMESLTSEFRLEASKCTKAMFLCFRNSLLFDPWRN